VWNCAEQKLTDAKLQTGKRGKIKKHTADWENWTEEV
jgi:hypothetical protein